MKIPGRCKSTLKPIPGSWVGQLDIMAKFNAWEPKKIPARICLFCDCFSLCKLILKFIQKNKHLRISRKTFKRKRKRKDHWILKYNLYN